MQLCFFGISSTEYPQVETPLLSIPFCSPALFLSLSLCSLCRRFGSVQEDREEAEREDRLQFSVSPKRCRRRRRRRRRQRTCRVHRIKLKVEQKQ